MPIYEYTCTNCGHKTDILHGINDPAPLYCPDCGAEGTLRKGFAPPAIVFKGSGWAKKDRAATRNPGSGAAAGATASSDSGGGASEKTATATESKSADSTSSSKPASSSGGGTAAD